METDKNSKKNFRNRSCKVCGIITIIFYIVYRNILFIFAIIERKGKGKET